MSLVLFLGLSFWHMPSSSPQSFGTEYYYSVRVFSIYHYVLLLPSTIDTLLQISPSRFVKTDVFHSSVAVALAHIVDRGHRLLILFPFQSIEWAQFRFQKSMSKDDRKTSFHSLVRPFPRRAYERRSLRRLHQRQSVFLHEVCSSRWWDHPLQWILHWKLLQFRPRDRFTKDHYSFRWSDEQSSDEGTQLCIRRSSLYRRESLDRPGLDHHECSSGDRVWQCHGGCNHQLRNSRHWCETRSVCDVFISCRSSNPHTCLSFYLTKKERKESTFATGVPIFWFKEMKFETPACGNQASAKEFTSDLTRASMISTIHLLPS